MAEQKALDKRAAEIQQSGRVKKAVVIDGQILVRAWQPGPQEWRPLGEGEPEPPQAA